MAFVTIHNTIDGDTDSVRFSAAVQEDATSLVFAFIRHAGRPGSSFLICVGDDESMRCNWTISRDAIDSFLRNAFAADKEGR